MLGTAKQLSISLGLYGPARKLHRTLFRSQRREFDACRALYSQFIEPGELAFDVGANIGTRTEILLSLGARVVAFEPQADCAKEIRARSPSDQLTVIQSAVGANPGHAALHLKDASAVASFLPDWGGKTRNIVNVPVTTLDLAIADFGVPTFCKIDVEGLETEVLLGLSHPIKYLSLEYQTNERGIANIKECLTRLGSLAKYEVSLTQYEVASLVTDWLPSTFFIKQFPGCAYAATYGDVFLRKI